MFIQTLPTFSKSWSPSDPSSNILSLYRSWFIQGEKYEFNLWRLCALMGLLRHPPNQKRAWKLGWEIIAPLLLLLSLMSSLHYGLRCSIGFWNEQKVDNSRCLFLSQKTPLSWRKLFFDQNMTQILYQKSFITFSENKYGQNHGQCSEKVEGGLSKGWIFVWWKYRPCREI